MSTLHDTVSIDLNLNVFEEHSDNHAVVSDGMFGVIQVNRGSASAASEDMDYLGATLVRFPGGTLAEEGRLVESNGKFQPSLNPSATGEYVYDIAPTNPQEIWHPALTSGNNGAATFEEVLADAVDRGADFSMIIPTARYFDDPDFEQAKADVEVFVTRLLSGTYNGGELPENFILDLGNEQYSNPIEYARFVSEIAPLIESLTADPSINQSGQVIKVAVQMPRGGEDFDRLMAEGYFTSSGYFDSNGHSSLDEASSIELPSSTDTVAKEAFLGELFFDILNGNIDSANAINALESIDILRLHALKVSGFGGVESKFDETIARYVDLWNSESIDHDPELYISAYTFKGQGTDAAYTMQATTFMLAGFSEMVASGVDYAAIWGMNSLGNSSTKLSGNGDDTFAPTAELLRLLNENTSGKKLIEGDTGYHATEGESFRAYTFADDQEVVLFLSAKDFSENQVEASISLEGLGFVSEVSGTTVRVSDGSAAGDAMVSDISVGFDPSDAMVSVTFEDPYQIVMVVLTIEEQPLVYTNIFGTEGRDELSGSASNEMIEGLKGSDLLKGRWGDDYLLGGQGSDRLLGGGGDDTLDGGRWHDILTGGQGSDVFVFVKHDGRDTVTDFEPAKDFIQIDGEIIDFSNLTAGHRLLEQGGDAVLKYGANSVISFNEVSVNDLLSAEIDINLIPEALV